MDTAHKVKSNIAVTEATVLFADAIGAPVYLSYPHVQGNAAPKDYYFYPPMPSLSPN